MKPEGKFPLQLKMVQHALEHGAKLTGRALALYALLCINALAQVNFAQIANSHLFDRERDISKSRTVLAPYIKKINERMVEEFNYKSVLVTGNLGIESLVSTIDQKTKKRALKTAKGKIGQEVTNKKEAVCYLSN